jgi:hypothetical protein
MTGFNASQHLYILQRNKNVATQYSIKFSNEDKQMKPIIGETNYKDMTPEDIAYYVREAEKLRAEAISDMFSAMGRAIKGLFTAPAETPVKPVLPTKVVINRSDMVGAN